MSVWNDIKGMWRSGGMLLRLIIINVAVFLFLLLTGLVMIMVEGGPQFADLWMGRYITPWLASTSDLGALLLKPWTAVTYMFTHEGVMHLVFNMFMFWFSGRLFGDLLGDRRLLGNYLLGGLAGFALFLLFAHAGPLRAYTSGGSIIGASASVTAVFIGIAVYQPEMVVRLFLFGAVRLKWLAVIFLLLDLISIRDGDNTGGHIAHLGGALYGYLAATQLKKGNDWSLGFINGLERIGKALTFQRSSRLKVVQSPRGKRMSDIDYNATRKAEQANIDVILDKISRSGYESLSKTEKDILFKASNDGKR
jgi:membrane associated rhomboid family serine protease